MFRLLSLFAVLAGSASALVMAGQVAFGTEAMRAGDNPLYAVFKAFPADTAYGAPLAAIALVAASFMVLRFLGFLISAIGGGLIVAMMVAVFLKPDWLVYAHTLLK